MNEEQKYRAYLRLVDHVVLELGLDKVSQVHLMTDGTVKYVQRLDNGQRVWKTKRYASDELLKRLDIAHNE